jgi:cytochrome c2
MEADNKDKAIARLSMAVICLTVLLFIAIILLLGAWYSSTQKEIRFECGVRDERGICGNAVFSLPPDVSQLVYDNGEKVFKQNCAVCHSMGKNKITGPGLEGLFQRVPSKEWAFHYISNSDSLFEIKDSYVLKLREEYPKEDEYSKHMFKKMLTAQEIENVITYIRVGR